MTKLTLQSGDRASLDDLTGAIKAFVERKGAEFKGPHTRPATRHRVPLYRRPSDPGRRFAPWEYAVFERRLEIVGHDEVARRIADWDFPSDTHVEVEVEQVRSVGSGSRGS